MDLFDHSNSLDLLSRPLPERLRPTDPSDLMGQAQALDVWLEIQRNGRIPNLILWGPPGTGKTTFATALQKLNGVQFKNLNAIELGAKDLRELGNQAKDSRRIYQIQTIAFIDEIHRLNKAQQDVLLPVMEKGDLILVGATTENPAYELNSALLSRSRVVIFSRLASEALISIAEKALISYKMSLSEIFTSEALSVFTEMADGDARRMLLNLEHLLQVFSVRESGGPLSSQELKSFKTFAPLRYDKKSNQHYDLISAMIKSIRDCDPDASVYYLVRMLKAGEDPRFIARRLIISASEDIGNADPRALMMAVAGMQALEIVGMPEASINLAQVATYLASVPKSRRSYEALRLSEDTVDRTGSRPVPLHLSNSKIRFMTEESAGGGNLPSGVEGPFYRPSTSGFEKQIGEFLNWYKANKAAVK